MWILKIHNFCYFLSFLNYDRHKIDLHYTIRGIKKRFSKTISYYFNDSTGYEYSRQITCSISASIAWLKYEPVFVLITHDPLSSWNSRKVSLWKKCGLWIKPKTLKTFCILWLKIKQNQNHLFYVLFISA